MPSTEIPHKLSAIVIGARTQRQGTGPFIAAGLQRAAVDVSGIVGTSEESVELARKELKNNWQLAPAGFTDLGKAIDALQPDAVAICSPWRVHAEQLQQVAASGCHCLVEKPLAWPASEAEVDQLITAFEQRRLLLQVVNQWPTTLPAFAALHGGLPEKIEQFAMRLSPISIGPDMVTDSAPHFIGMLQALVGAGDCLRCSVETSDAEDGEQQMLLSCNYEHLNGLVEARLTLKTRQARPRPASYRINELQADREVELPDYQQYLTYGNKRVPVPDPMHQVTADFAEKLAGMATTNGDLLRSAHRNLLQLAAAWN